MARSFWAILASIMNFKASATPHFVVEVSPFKVSLSPDVRRIRLSTQECQEEVLDFKKLDLPFSYRHLLSALATLNLDSIWNNLDFSATEVSWSS